MSTSFCKIASSKSKEYKDAITIYTTAFPVAEQQPLKRMKERLDKKLFSMYALKENKQVIGMAVVWKFKSAKILLLDYVAIDKKLRGKGLGKIFLEWIINKALRKGEVIGIEIEHPGKGRNRIQRKNRLNFYLSCGAKVLENVDYFMPALDGTKDIEMQLLVMHSGFKGMSIHQADVKEFIGNLYSKVYLLGAEHPLVISIINSVPIKIKISK
jgi:GNAT superfamily N-acetyltransferase